MAKILVEIEFPQFQSKEDLEETLKQQHVWFPHGTPEGYIAIDKQLLTPHPEMEGFFLFRFKDFANSDVEL